MKNLKPGVLLAGVALAFLLIAGVAAAALEIPHGDYEVWSANADRTEFVLAFTGDYNWHVLAQCIEPDLLPPAIGAICTYNGEYFACPGAQRLGLLEILQQPPTPTPRPTATATPTPTYTPSATPTATATFTSTATLLPSTTASPLPSFTPFIPTPGGPTWTPVLPGAPLSAELQATISAANQALQQPQPVVRRMLLEWIQWIFQRILAVFGK